MLSNGWRSRTHLSPRDSPTQRRSSSPIFLNTHESRAGLETRYHDQNAFWLDLNRAKLEFIGIMLQHLGYFDVNRPDRIIFFYEWPLVKTNDDIEITVRCSHLNLPKGSLLMKLSGPNKSKGLKRDNAETRYYVDLEAARQDASSPTTIQNFRYIAKNLRELEFFNDPATEEQP
ncbi:uncharacterized protein BO97DRAFT_415057 [Aspergillus homomorphus CBS 101889]|uniref:Uncharacterized protein n=1 Tax=Aspergillus homomorphus (strain CBS 101889) TaxID=1450537 RepID=A0A395HU66_ASPHC|nr:hypothetical protein BO97DRAFT_415057 [Aspergillus homomorphus CBS 101889]RAL11471.1 hypothetical protein BO97DRAFT_415057 [Aspergillus homomorphus CBS 101889]